MDSGRESVREKDTRNPSIQKSELHRGEGEGRIDYLKRSRAFRVFVYRVSQA